MQFFISNFLQSPVSHRSQYSPQHTQTHSFFVLAFTWDIMAHIHTKQQVKLCFCIVRATCDTYDQFLSDRRTVWSGAGTDRLATTLSRPPCLMKSGAGKWTWNRCMEAGTFTTQGLHKWGQTYNRTLLGYQSLWLVFVNNVEHGCSRKELCCNLWRVYIYLHTYQVLNGLEHPRRSHAETCRTQMKIYANKNLIDPSLNKRSWMYFQTVTA